MPEGSLQRMSDASSSFMLSAGQATKEQQRRLCANTLQWCSYAICLHCWSKLVSAAGTRHGTSGAHCQCWGPSSPSLLSSGPQGCRSPAPARLNSDSSRSIVSSSRFDVRQTQHRRRAKCNTFQTHPIQQACTQQQPATFLLLGHAEQAAVQDERAAVDACCQRQLAEELVNNQLVQVLRDKVQQESMLVAGICISRSVVDSGCKWNAARPTVTPACMVSSPASMSIASMSPARAQACALTLPSWPLYLLHSSHMKP